MPLLYACLVTLLLTGPVYTAEPNLAQLSLEELMDIEVFSVSKKEEQLFQSSAAIAVLTREDIRRSGATSIPEALRQIPGMEVARIDASKWAVSARGFNDIFSDKLLVLIDGRAIYTPLFSGVFWDSQELPLDDVERIEVVRGPGAALWGSNAVNGVINILTRHTRDTQGFSLRAGAGSEERTLVSGRYGAQLNPTTHYRGFFRYIERDALKSPEGHSAADGWQHFGGGFRLDSELSPRDELTLQGDLYSGDINQPFEILTSAQASAEERFNAVTPISGVHLQSRWQHTLSNESDLILQLYYDRDKRDEAVLAGHLDIVDVDFQHRFKPDRAHEIVWGFGYRYHRDDFAGTFAGGFSPEARTYDQFSGFAQDQIALIPHRLELTLGAKLEHNDFSGGEFQPGARLVWTPDDRHSAWAAASRAVRASSRGDEDLRSALDVVAVANGPTTLVLLEGNPHFRSEKMNAFELGYRSRLSERLFFDLASFYNAYDELRTVELELPYPDPQAPEERLILPAVFQNRMSGRTYGSELALSAQPDPAWRLRASYAYLKIDLDLDANSSYTNGLLWEGISPHHRLGLSSAHDLGPTIDLDLMGRYTSELPGAFTDSYFGFDARLAWQLRPNLELALFGHDLLYAQRAQIRIPHGPTRAANAERGVQVSLYWTP